MFLLGFVLALGMFWVWVCIRFGFVLCLGMLWVCFWFVFLVWVFSGLRVFFGTVLGLGNFWV